MAFEDTWTRIEAIFTEALTRPADERAAFVRSQCDGTVQAEVMKLLGAQEEMGSFLQAPMLDFTGQTFGAYRAEREIGRGGMSVVYLGNRVDFEKRVAIKVILLQAVGSFSQSETQILASLEHPNIARLLDAGTTELGFRYLVMEYVEGQACTAFDGDKLGLFLQVCAGVQYAHRSLVVHRDLKPDNILVTEDGTAKLLDFGIAKILTADAAQTVGVRAYTADYASPEQILGKPVTTATDVYSLGVLLCELLGGRPPRTLAGLELAEMVAKAQGDEVSDVPLTGDLAVIARKALRREPGERYDSVSALARDIERYREGRAIEARVPSWGYLAGKFVKRNRYLVGAAGLAAAALTVATGVAIWQARLAGQRFEQVRTLARSVMFDLHDVVSPLPGSVVARKMIVDRSLTYLDGLAADTNASEDVQLDVARGYVRLADILGTNYEGASLGDSKRALESAERAVSVARKVPGRAGEKVLLEALDRVGSAQEMRGEAVKAQASAEEAIALAGRLGEQGLMAEATLRLAGALSDQDKRKEAMPYYERVVALRKPLATDAKGRFELGRAENFLGGAYFWIDDLAKSEAHFLEAARLAREAYASGIPRARASLASDVGQLAAVYGEMKQFEKSVAMYHEQLRLRQEMAAEDPKDAVTAMRVTATKDRLSYAYRRAGKAEEAVRWGEEALSEIQHMADTGSVNWRREMMYTLTDLAQAYELAKRMDKACPLVRQGLLLMKTPVTDAKGQAKYLEQAGERCRKRGG